MDADWDWKLTNTARSDFADLDAESQRRIARKLDEIVDDPWREPADHVEPLEDAVHGKLRIGAFRLGCRVDREAAVLWVLRIRPRGGDAYRGDD